MKECVFEVKILGKTGITLRIKTHTYNSTVPNFELLFLNFYKELLRKFIFLINFCIYFKWQLLYLEKGTF